MEVILLAGVFVGAFLGAWLGAIGADPVTPVLRLLFWPIRWVLERLWPAPSDEEIEELRRELQEEMARRQPFPLL